MSDRVPDMEIAVKISPNPDPDGYDWVAKSKILPKITGVANDPEEALERFVEELRRNEKNSSCDIGHEITGVSAVVRTYARENRTHAEFCTEEPHPDPGAPPVEVAAPPDKIAATGTLRVSLDAATMGAIANAVQECREEISYDTFGISLDVAEVDAIADGIQTDIILPSTAVHVAQGDHMIVYERGKGGGRMAYVGEFVVGAKNPIERGDLWNAEWQRRLHADAGQMSKKFGIDVCKIAVEILAYREYAEPIPIPDGEIAPRGTNWLSPSHLAKIFPGASE